MTRSFARSVCASPPILTSSSASPSSKATLVRVPSPARFIESEALAGRRSLSSRLPQYLMRAILAQLTAVAFRFDIGRRPPFLFLRPPVYHAHLASQSIAACPRRSHGLEGLKPESHSECVKFSGGQRRVSDPLVDSRFQLVKTLPERRVVRHEVGLGAGEPRPQDA